MLYVRAILLISLLNNVALARTVSLTWDAPTSSVTYTYIVYRADNQSNFVRIGTVTYPSVQYTDTSAPNIGKYCYAVTAIYTGTGESDYSNMVCLPPEAPINLRVQ